MPLDADYTWRQTDDTLAIDVPLKGSSASSVDILATELLLKVSFGRYLLQLDLLHAIDDTACVAKVSNLHCHIVIQQLIACCCY